MSDATTTINRVDRALAIARDITALEAEYREKLAAMQHQYETRIAVLRERFANEIDPLPPMVVRVKQPAPTGETPLPPTPENATGIILDLIKAAPRTLQELTAKLYGEEHRNDERGKSRTSAKISYLAKKRNCPIEKIGDCYTWVDTVDSPPPEPPSPAQAITQPPLLDA